MRTVYIKKDRAERFNMKRGWFVNAWRLVDEQGKDQVQPWFNTKGEAIQYANNSGWAVAGTYGEASLAS